MYYNQSCAAKGEKQANGHRHMPNRTMQRAAVNVYRSESSIEMLVFAPGRIKEHFKIDAKGNQLSVSYFPPDGFVRPEWILREYSRGGFARTFALDESVDVGNISAKYVDGVLQVSLPLVPGSETPKREIVVN
ncbi:MAG: Hsp20/alpha crystallin family protein [Ferruginibacter sp.]